MAGNEFLDKAGLAVLWERIKQLVYECCCGNKDYECINDEVVTSECFEKAVLSVTGGGGGGDCGFSCDGDTVTTTECFDKAVQSVGGALIIEGDTTRGSELNHTFAEIREAFASGRGVIYHFVSNGLNDAIPWYTTNIDLMDGDTTNYRYVCVSNGRNGYVTYVADSDDDYPYIPIHEEAV